MKRKMKRTQTKLNIIICLLIIGLTGGLLMADFNGLFTTTGTGYPQAEVAQMMASLSDGIVPNYENELATTLDSGLDVETDTGFAWSRGFFFYRDAADTVTVDAATAGYNRLDRIVVEFDSGTGGGTIKVSKGTETTGTPTAPALVDTATVWEVHLAYVDITGSTINSVDDSDRIIYGAQTRPKYYVKLSRSADQTSGTFTSWDNEEKNVGDMFDSATPTRIATIKEDGFYTINYSSYELLTSAGVLSAKLYVNGVQVNSGAVLDASSGTTAPYSFPISITLWLEEGDYIEIDSSPTGGYTTGSPTNKISGDILRTWVTVIG